MVCVVMRLKGMTNALTLAKKGAHSAGGAGSERAGFECSGGMRAISSRSNGR